jgi:hypothetical protein
MNNNGPSQGTDSNPGSPPGQVLSRSYIRGTQPLWKAIFIVCVLGGLIVGVLNNVLLAAALATEMTGFPKVSFRPINAFVFLSSSLLIAYAAFASVAMWRCAPNTNMRWFGQCARLFSVVFASYWLWFIGSLLFRTFATLNG